MRPLLIICSLVVIACICVFYPLQVSAEDDPATIKTRFDKDSGIPDHVFLPLFLETVTAVEDNRGHNHDHRVMQVQRRLSLSTYDQSQSLLNEFISYRDRILTKKNEFLRRNVCPLGSPRPTGIQVYEKLDAFDENNDVLGAAYIAEMKENMDKESIANLLLWMDDLKRGSIIIRFDHKKVYKNDDPDLVRQRVCGQFDSSNSSVN